MPRRKARRLCIGPPGTAMRRQCAHCSITAPRWALYGLKGEWEVENIGISPDIEVEFDPASWRKGHDPQLERAVELTLEELKRNPQPTFKKPAFPNYHKN